MATRIVAYIVLIAACFMTACDANEPERMNEDTSKRLMVALGVTNYQFVLEKGKLDGRFHRANMCDEAQSFIGYVNGVLVRGHLCGDSSLYWVMWQ